MIRYRLVCEHEHSFESWFQSSAAYDRLAAIAGVACPDCGSTAVGKALMAPSLRTAKAVVPAAVASPELKQPMAARMPAEMVEMLRKVRRHLRDNADYVGSNFAEEARKIHYQEVAPHGIYGEATREEAAELHEEGIDVQPLPPLPEDVN